MSKQLTLSAVAAALSMAVLALVAGQGGFASAGDPAVSGQPPLFDLAAMR